MELAAEPGGPLGEGGAFPITQQQRFSLERREELLGETSEAALQGREGDSSLGCTSSFCSRALMG